MNSAGITIDSNSIASELEDEMEQEVDWLSISDEQWRERLTEQQYLVTRQKGMEPPFSGEYNYFDEEGIYRCVCCGQELFNSDTKYDSNSGWPSFYEPASNTNVKLVKDFSEGMIRTEAVCSRCGAHLGHVYDDEVPPTGLRYCINSLALEFSRSKIRPLMDRMT